MNLASNTGGCRRFAGATAQWRRPSGRAQLLLLAAAAFNVLFVVQFAWWEDLFAWPAVQLYTLGALPPLALARVPLPRRIFQAVVGILGVLLLLAGLYISLGVPSTPVIASGAAFIAAARVGRKGSP